MTQLPIDSYGAIFKTRQLPAADNGRQTKLDTIARYKFCLALANSIADDYVKEKVMMLHFASGAADANR